MIKTGLQAQLDLRYKRFQWYVDALDVHMPNGLDDSFIAAYDAKDLKGCMSTLMAMSDALCDAAAKGLINKDYLSWSNFA